MNTFTLQSAVAVAMVLLAPLVWSTAFKHSRVHADRLDAFLINRGSNGFVATMAGAVAGNIGIGSFLALFLFANQAPLLAFSIVGAYTLGLVLCAVFANKIRAKSKAVNAVGLVDLIAKSHAIHSVAPIWFPVAFVFVLRSAVQLGALGFIVANVFGGSAALTIALCALLIGSYLIFGGYRAAVQTDIFQAAMVVVVAAICAFGLPQLDGSPKALSEFGEYKPVILIGIWLFIPWSAVLAVDNWQRITVAETDQTARNAYYAASFVCCMVFAVMAFAGYYAPVGADMYATFNQLAPSGLGWIATAMFVACIMSSIDTFIMPLVSAAAANRAIAQVRGIIIALVAATALTAIFFSDTLDTIIAAFNSLAVFLPAAFGALYLTKPAGRAAMLSMYLGLATAVTVSTIDQNSASLAGFVIAVFAYAITSLVGDKSQPS